MDKTVMSGIAIIGWPIVDPLFSSLGSCETTFSDLMDAINANFKTNVQDAISPGLPTKYGNEDFTVPNDDRWAWLTVLWNKEPEQITVGSKVRFRYHGIVQLNFHTSLNIGDKEVVDIADFAKPFYNMITTSDIVYKVPDIGTSHRNDGRYRLIMSCPFHADVLCNF